MELIEFPLKKELKDNMRGILFVRLCRFINNYRIIIIFGSKLILIQASDRVTELGRWLVEWGEEEQFNVESRKCECMRCRLNIRFFGKEY